MSIEIEYNLSSSVVPEYGMFSELGNAGVHAVVLAARANKMNWAQTVRALQALAEQEQFGEAMDTAVREVVYDALNFDTPFYY
jgi:2-methylisocitrate lyase-like PEP mutase family enzyme